MDLRLHSFLPESLVNGPGLRSVFWVQGCTLGCRDCWNPGAWDPQGGSSVSVEDLVERIPCDVVEGISFSGGEPFQQAEACALLSSMIRRKGLNVLAFSGYTYQEIAESEDEWKLEFLNNLNYLIDGPYIKDHAPEHPLTGSGNQRVLILEKGEITNELCSGKDGHYRQREIRITKEGCVIETGF